MIKFIKTIESTLAAKIENINSETSDPITRAELCMHEVQEVMDRLNPNVRNHKFKSRGDEIHFFKHTKPLFLSKLIYYNKVYRLEIRRPTGGKSVIAQYYNSIFTLIDHFNKNNYDFYTYYRARHYHLDHTYFTRGNVNLKLVEDSAVCQFDPKCCTMHDFTVANILANDALSDYANDKLKTLEGGRPDRLPVALPSGQLQWKETKTALVELLYALHFAGAFNSQDIKSIALFTEKTFNVQLGDIYKVFSDLKLRNNPTRFIDSLRTVLLKKLEEEEVLH